MIGGTTATLDEKHAGAKESVGSPGSGGVAKVGKRDVISNPIGRGRKVKKNCSQSKMKLSYAYYEESRLGSPHWTQSDVSGIRNGSHASCTAIRIGIRNLELKSIARTKVLYPWSRIPLVFESLQKNKVVNSAQEEHPTG